MLAPVLAALALVCHGQHAPLTDDQQRQAGLERYAEQRASFGFRSDIPYVEELIRRGVWEYDVGYIPVTQAENRYLRLRDRLFLGRRAERYLRARRDLDGGISIEDDWPRGPYLLVRLTRDRAAHEANLKRLARFPDNLRTAPVRWSERQLTRLANRIDPGLEELKAAGFDVASWGPDISTNTVLVELITTRTDHAEYFRERYGPVTTEVIATEPTRQECAEARRYRISATGESLLLSWGASGDAKPDHVELVEHADRVEVGIVQRLPNAGQTDDDVPYSMRVALSAPLGDRAVIDAANGLRVRQSGPSPGEPACAVVRGRTFLDEHVDRRREMGLPHGRAFVRRMLRRRIPFTRAEQSYVEAWEELELDERAGAYFRRHGDEYGGSEVRGTFPGRPYLLARFTRRLALHRRSLAALVDARVRVVAAARTVAELRELEEAIHDAVVESRGFLDGWGDAGILIRNVHTEAGRVIVQVVTPRDDFATVLRALYGPAVKAVRVGMRHECS